MTNQAYLFEGFVRERWQEQIEKSNMPFPVVAALGLAGETGEVVELLKKHYRDGADPNLKLLLELGDVLHYLTVIAASYDFTLGMVMQANMDKLRKRDAERGR